MKAKYGIFTGSQLALVLAVGGIFFGLQPALAAITWPSAPTGEAEGGKIYNILQPDLTNRRVGIGIGDPATRLHLIGTGDRVTLTSNSTDGTGGDCALNEEKVYLDPTGMQSGFEISGQTINSVGDVYVCTDDGGIAWVNGEEKWWMNASTQSAFDSSGRLVIGDTSVSSGLHLDIEGKIGTTDLCAADGSNCISQATLAGLSDARLKENVSLVSGLAGISQLNGVLFDWKASGETSIGVLAQEVEAVYPQLVSTADDELGTKSVHYDGLIAPLIEAVKELKAENKLLRERVNQLEKQIGGDATDLSATTSAIQYGGFCPAVLT